MLIPLSATVATLRLPKTEAWYGPATATFPLQFAGNPYDPAENDVQVVFTDKAGHRETRLAYFNEPIGSWQAILVAHHSGTYQARLIRNGQPIPAPNKEGAIKLMAPLPHGFVRPDPGRTNRFIWDDGTSFSPIGFDLAWQNGDILPITDQLAKMGQAGVNWTRIWACAWDGKNPWWPSDKTKLAPRTLWPSALAKWDRIEEACSANHVAMQFVLFHHGEFSSKVDPNWPDNPWNVKNGGFLQKPGDFFTDAEAKARAKIWLRYAVARYAASPGLFGWELFNEVQWVDPIQIDHRWDEVEAWHREMANYVRSIDPYHHPVTSSSELRPNFDSSFDYLQPHTYPNNVFAAVVSTVMPESKPGFYGEFGLSNMNGADNRKVVMDGLLGGLMANHAGSGMFWYWDTVEKNDLYPAFAIGRKVVDLSGWYSHPEAKSSSPGVQTKDKAAFTFEPGAGWGPTTQFSYDLPTGATPSSLGKISSYFQGKSHKDLRPQPIQFNFKLDRPSKLVLTVGQVSDSGAHLVISLDGQSIYQSQLQPKSTVPPIELPLPAGTHRLQLDNDGADWFTLKSLTIDNIAPTASATSLSDAHWMMARVTLAAGASTSTNVRLSGLNVSDGAYRATWVDLASGASTTFTVQVKDSSLDLDPQATDEILILQAGTK